MIRCPRCDRLVIHEEVVHRCPDCSASLTNLVADPEALRRQEWRTWLDARLTGVGARRAFRSGLIWGGVLGGGSFIIGSFWMVSWWTLVVTIEGAFFGALVAFLRLGHLSSMIVYGIGMIAASMSLNPFAWIQFVAAGAVIAFITRDRRQGM